MQYRRDTVTGKDLSVLGFGCMRLPGTLGLPDIAKTERLFLRAIERGVNYFDTAYLYPGSEDAVGQIFERNGLRDKACIATKLPQMMCKERGDFDKFFDIQRKRLRTERADYYLIHNVSDQGQWQRLRELGIEEWIAGKKASGQIGSMGFSFHGPRDHFGAVLDSYDWDFCQIQYNYMNTHYQAGIDGLRKAAAKGIPVVIMEPLLGGKLATGLPKKAEAVLRSRDPGRTNAAWALDWIWNQAEPTLLLSGMNSAEQLEENLALADEARPGMLGPAEAEAIELAVAALKESYKVPCTGCNYCMPCPVGINIPACFTAYNASYSISRMYGITAYVTGAGALSKTPHYATDCVRCGKCAKHCPQQIAIPDRLEEAARRVEPFYLRPVLKLAGLVFRG